jgi:SAM-dependent methyltransferase
VLDVGAGGGAASLPLAPPAGLLVAVDESQAMLDSFAEAATRRGIRHELIAGWWPDVAAAAPQVDVVVCHHVVYNVADLTGFLRALTDRARRRVVVELTERHPLSGLAPLWLSIHDLERPSGPTSVDAADAATALGYDVNVVRFQQPSLWESAPAEERIAFARRLLCVGPEHDDEIAAYFGATAGERRELATLWWERPRL